MADPEIYVKFMRRWHVLDRPEVLERDEDLLWRAAAIFKERMAAEPSVPPPSREDLCRVSTKP